MHHDDILEFCEDISNGDLITLLLNDNSQEIGIVKKIRTTSIKLDLIDTPSPISISVLFSDIRRYAIGKYNFIRKPAAMGQDVRQDEDRQEELSALKKKHDHTACNEWQQPVEHSGEVLKSRPAGEGTPSSGKDHSFSTGGMTKSETSQRGMVIEFKKQSVCGQETLAGTIRSDDGREYFFLADHIIDVDLKEALLHNDFSHEVFFHPFINKAGYNQAGYIEKWKYNNYTESQFKSVIQERNIHDRAIEKITNGDRDGAIAFLKKEIENFPQSKTLHLLFGQQLSAVGRSEEAAEVYARLMQIEDRPNARKNAHIQYALLLGKAGNITKARDELAKLLRQYPEDAFLKSLQDKLLQYEIGSDLDIWEESDTMAVPQLLKKELEYAEFYDPKIVSRGGVIFPEDADRLKKEALSLEKDSQEVYFKFLEAAKAYSLLPPGTFVYDDYRECLSRYATQKGAVLTNRMLGLASSPALTRKNAEILASLSDSAICYFIEGLSLLPKESTKFLGSAIIRNFLRCLLFKYFAQSPDAYDSSLLNCNGTAMLARMLDPGNRELFRLVCQAILTWGSYPEVWNRLMNVSNGPGVFAGKLRDPHFRQVVKESFAALTGHTVDAEQPRDFLSGYFLFLKKERDSLDATFRFLQRLPNSGSFDYFKTLQQEFEKFPMDNRALQESDIRVLKSMKFIINNMMSYRNATDQERTDILVRARRGVINEDNPNENRDGFSALQKNIVSMPTYWLLVGCESIIKQCLIAIDKMEQLRAERRKPQLTFSLEPPIFQKNGEKNIHTALMISNSGVATATNVRISICLKTAGDAQKPLFQQEHFLEKQPSKSCGKAIDLVIPYHIVKDHKPGAIQLILEACYDGGKTKPIIFTVDIDKGSHFTREMIPWNFAGKVHKEAFKGREDIIDKLASALNKKTDRAFSYILYGVTRSGKTSILDFLRQRIHGDRLTQDPEGRYFFCVQWEFGNAANCSNSQALWQEFLCSSMRRALKDWNVSPELRQRVSAALPNPQTVHSENFWQLMEKFRDLQVYPVVLIDEFTFYRNMHDNGLLTPSFLSSIRELALNDYATFIMAGTYDLLDIIKDDHYGITGQFVNLIKEHVTNIKKGPAKELVNIFSKHLAFTHDACDHIVQISDCRPYIIQIICYYCALYAERMRHSILGLPEVEHVIAILCGEVPPESDISKLESSRFDNNLIFAKEKHYHLFVAVTTVLSHEGSSHNGFVSYAHLRSIWEENGLEKEELATALDELSERHVIEGIADEGDRGYRIKVELFRRWWRNEHPHMEKEIDVARAAR